MITYVLSVYYVPVSTLVISRGPAWSSPTTIGYEYVIVSISQIRKSKPMADKQFALTTGGQKAKIHTLRPS